MLGDSDLVSSHTRRGKPSLSSQPLVLFTSPPHLLPGGSLFWDRDCSYLFSVGTSTPQPVMHSFLPDSLVWESVEELRDGPGLLGLLSHWACPHGSPGSLAGRLAWALFSDVLALGLTPIFCLTTWLINVLHLFEMSLFFPWGLVRGALPPQ